MSARSAVTLSCCVLTMSPSIPTNFTQHNRCETRACGHALTVSPSICHRQGPVRPVQVAERNQAKNSHQALHTVEQVQVQRRDKVGPARRQPNCCSAGSHSRQSLEIQRHRTHKHASAQPSSPAGTQRPRHWCLRAAPMKAERRSPACRELHLVPRRSARGWVGAGATAMAGG